MNSSTLFTTGALMLALGISSASAQTGTTGTTDKVKQPAQASTSKTSTTHGILAPARASEIIGMNIEDAAGNDIAEIKDLVVCDSGEVMAVVEVDARDDAKVGIPLNQLMVRLDDDQREAKAMDKDTPAAAGSETPDIEKFALKGDRTLFDAAPILQDEKLLDHAWLRSSVDHYKGKAAAKAMGDKEKDGMKDGDVEKMYAAKPTCVKRLIGEDVKGTDGDGIGDVKDVAIDLGSSQVAYAIVSTGGVLGMGNQMHAVPFDRLTINEDSVTIPMTKDGVSKLPSVDLDRLPAHATGMSSIKTDRTKDGHSSDHDKHVDGDKRKDG